MDNTQIDLEPRYVPIETRKDDKARKKWLPPAPKLSSSQVARLSEINADLGIVSIASVVLPTILGELETIFFIIGTALAILLWSISLVLLKYK